MGKLISVIHQKRVLFASIILSLLYVIASLSIFYGVRVLFLIIANYGLNSLSVIPFFLTSIFPLFFLFMVIMYIHSSSVSKRRTILLITGTIFTLFGLFLTIFSIFLMIDYKSAIAGNITPLFPLDILLFNIVIFLVGICILVFRSIDSKNSIITANEKRLISPLKLVLLGFYLPFAAYFFGELLFGFMYVFEGYVSPKWYGVLPIYLLYAALTIGLVLAIISIHVPSIKKTKFNIIATSSLIVYTLICVVWYNIAYNLDPYLIANGLVWEFQILISIKKPFGYLAIPAWVVPTCLYYLIKTIVLHFKKKNEQE